MRNARLVAPVLAAGLTTAAATGCATPGPAQLVRFEGAPRQLVLEDYFLGETRAYGLFEDRFRNVRRQFTVDILGEVEGNRLTLTEHFVYDDGELDTRIWEIDILGNGRYRGTAGDVPGYAEGQVTGNAFNWKYKVDLKVGDSVWNVGFNDWMFLMEDGVLINRAYVTRFGVEIGQVTIAFRKP
ncbi:DUF3833 domain-containing protein [Hyphomonas sp.]|uniref:DUF3833 domain-containing protein n=1 Tax=Hyphomonas sp. TaxID=87 RepID=UPI00391BC329